MAKNTPILDFLKGLVQPTIDYTNQRSEDLKKASFKQKTLNALLGPFGVFVKPQGGFDKQGAKAVANIASFLVPYGKVAKGAGAAGNLLQKFVLPGASSGALSSFSQKDSNLASTVEGGLTGGLVGGLTGPLLNKVLGAGKGKNVFSKVGDDLRSGVLKPKVNVSPTFKVAEERIQKAAQKFGFKGSASAQAEQMATKYGKLTNRVDRLAEKSAVLFNPKEIVDDAINKVKLKTDISKGVGKENVEFWTNKLKDATSAKPLTALKFELQGQLSNAYKKLKMGNPLTKDEKIMLSFHDAIDNKLKNNVSGIKKTLSDLSLLHDIAPGLNTSAKQAAKGINIPVVGNVGGQVAGDLGQGLQDISGRVLQKSGQTAKGLSGLLQKASQSPVGQVAKQGSIPTLMQILQGGGQSQSEQESIETPQAQQGTPQLDESGYWQWDAQANDWVPSEKQLQQSQGQQGGLGGITPEIIQQAMIMDLQQTGGKNIPELKAISDIIPKDQNKKYSEGDKKFLLAKNEATKALNALDQGNVQTGKLAAAGSKIGEFLGTQDTSTTSFKAQLSTARTATRNALLGANMSDKELESYLDAIFDYSNEPSIIKAKLQTFIKSMQDYEDSIAGNSEIMPIQ